MKHYSSLLGWNLHILSYLGLSGLCSSNNDVMIIPIVHMTRPFASSHASPRPNMVLPVMQKLQYLDQPTIQVSYIQKPLHLHLQRVYSGSTGRPNPDISSKSDLKDLVANKQEKRRDATRSLPKPPLAT
jgi:hypothetical protein